VNDIQRKEAGADFSDRPKSRAATTSDAVKQIRKSIRNANSLEERLALYAELDMAIRAQSGVNAPGTLEESRAISAHSGGGQER
jgi:hypothetical protein